MLKIEKCFSLKKLSILLPFAFCLFTFAFCLLPLRVSALDTTAASATFAEIYEKLDTVSWGGKNISVAIEGLEKLNPNAHIAATDDRVVLVWKDSIIANFPRPEPRDWDGFGEITTSLVMKIRENDRQFAALSDSATYRAVVGALLSSIDENGRYIYSKSDAVAEDGRILTSVGIDGGRDASDNFKITGVIKDSPADTAGLKSGDIITAINGVPVLQMFDNEILSGLSGFNSGTLKLSVDGRVVVLRRATVVLADADIVNRAQSTDNSEQILEIIIHKISDNSVAIVNEALAKHSNASGIILDLRAASGDDVRAAAKLAGLFIGRVPVMRIVDSVNSESEIIPGGDAVTDAKIVVLVSDTTSGTAEGLAAAFSDNDGGVLVGTPTSGASRIATLIDLSNGGALEVWDKSIKTGFGNVIDGRGVFPIVCLSNIRTLEQQGAFFVNVVNGDFNARDFNGDDTVALDAVRRGCPTITSGADEDMVSMAVAIKILTDSKVYNSLIDN